MGSAFYKYLKRALKALHRYLVVTLEQSRTALREQEPKFFIGPCQGTSLFWRATDYALTRLDMIRSDTRVGCYAAPARLPLFRCIFKALAISSRLRILTLR